MRGTLVARPAANLLLVRHDAVPALGMQAMDLMAVFGEAEAIDRAGVVEGQRVRLGVRPKDEQLTLLWIEPLK
ncbi:MAG TPA: copper-binding protein [Terriglobales bacterium]|nr:copper-binding protein [Terriglobales bacterium]